MATYTQGMPDAFSKFIDEESSVGLITTEKSPNAEFQEYLNCLENGWKILDVFGDINHRIGDSISLIEIILNNYNINGANSQDAPTHLARINTAMYELIFLLNVYTRFIYEYYDDVVDNELYLQIRHNGFCIQQFYQRIVSEVSGYATRYYPLRNDFVLNNFIQFYKYILATFPMQSRD